MSKTLFLYLGEGWPQHSVVCSWRLAEGVLPQHDGESAPVDWPQADRHIAILSMEQVRYTLVALPPGLRWDDAVPLAMAIEEQLAAPLEQQVVVPVRRVAQFTLCAIVQSLRLKTLLAYFTELQRPLIRIECEADKLAPPDDGWHVYRTPHGHWLHDGSRALALDAVDGCHVPLVLQLALAEAAQPPALFLSGATEEQVAQWSQGLHAQVQAAPPYDWRVHCAMPGANLLVGDLAPRSAWLAQPRARLALAMLTLALVGRLGLDAGGWISASWHTRQLREQQQAVLRGVADGPVTRRPDQALRTIWAAARARIGEPGADEFLPTLSALAQVLPTRTWSRIEFTQDKLTVDWQGSAQDAERAEVKLVQSGYQSVAKTLGADQVSTSLRFGEEP